MPHPTLAVSLHTDRNWRQESGAEIKVASRQFLVCEL